MTAYIHKDVRVASTKKSSQRLIDVGSLHPFVVFS